MTVYYNTVIYQHQVSLRCLAPEELTGIIAFLRQSLTTPAHPIKARNNRVIEGLCQQFEFWIGTESDTGILRQKCRVYLEQLGPEPSGAFRPLLSILALDRFSEEMAGAAFPMNGPNGIRQNPIDLNGSHMEVGGH